MDKPILPKYIVCLEHFLKNKLTGMNRIDALQAYDDTCLHTTVSYLFNQYGIEFKRVPERVVTRSGAQVDYTRYWLKSEHYDFAQQLIDSYKKSPGW